MLGKGLESLIPKKNNSAGGFDDDAGSMPQQQNQQTHGNFGGSQWQPEQPTKDEYQNTFSNDLHQENESQPKEQFEERQPAIAGPVFHIEIEKVQENPYQPRKSFNQEALKELAASIREFGILQPVVVVKIQEETEFGTRVRYQLIAGHRRLLASKMLGLTTIPAIIREELKKNEALEIAIVENIQRADLSAIETARAYARLSDEFSLTQREIAQRLGKSREAVANALRLLSLPSEIQDALVGNIINESQARLLMPVSDPIIQKQLFDQLVQENLSVRELKHRIDNKAQPNQQADQNQPPRLSVEDMQLKSIEKEMAELLGAPVKIEFSKNGGKIVIHFFSPEEAMGIARRIGPYNQRDDL